MLSDVSATDWRRADRVQMRRGYTLINYLLVAARHCSIAAVAVTMTGVTCDRPSHCKRGGETAPCVSYETGAAPCFSYDTAAGPLSSTKSL